MKLDPDKMGADAKAAGKELDPWMTLAELTHVSNLNSEILAHIVNCSPPAILAMIAEIRALREGVADLDCNCLEQHEKGCPKLLLEKDRKAQ